MTALGPLCPVCDQPVDFDDYPARVEYKEAHRACVPGSPIETQYDAVTWRERTLILIHCAGYARIFRKSEREFDLGVMGRYPEDYPYMAGARYIAWLPLAVIRDVGILIGPTGDWSFTRDAEQQEQWEHFDDAVERAYGWPKPAERSTEHGYVDR